MTEVKSVGVREFRDHATTYLSGSEPIAINKHGRVIGFYIPLERDDTEVARAVAHLGSVVEDIVAGTGLSEDDLATMLNLRRPLS